MAHPHIKAIESMPASSLIGIIEESKMTYVREKLSISLHESQIKLFKQVKKHDKPHHRKIRARQYEKAEKTAHFKLHEKLYLNKYKKLARKDLIEVDENPDNGLAYDCSLTEYGREILDEISDLEKEWEGVVGISDDDLNVIKSIALDSFEISYNHKKNRDFIF